MIWRFNPFSPAGRSKGMRAAWTVVQISYYTFFFCFFYYCINNFSWQDKCGSLTVEIAVWWRFSPPSLRPDVQKKQPEDDLASKPIQSPGSSQSSVFSSDSSSSSSQSLSLSLPPGSEPPSAAESGAMFSSRTEGKRRHGYPVHLF